MKIQLKEINYFYGQQQALFNINLHYSNKGEKIVLLGPSGAGKSSLLRVFNLLAEPTSGHYQFNDSHFNFSHPPTEKIARQLRQQVGMVFQQYNLWPHLTVINNLIEAPRRLLGYSKSVAIAKAMIFLESLQLLDVIERYPLHLSGGQQQRVAIARALMMEPKLLLFDEPTAALDPEITTQVATIINELALSGITQIIVTHEVNFARKIATQFVYMEQGKIIEQGDLQQLNTPHTQQLTHYLSH